MYLPLNGGNMCQPVHIGAVDDPTSANTAFTVPADANPGDTIHLILEATDNGTPQMNRYHRLIITVAE